MKKTLEYIGNSDFVIRSKSAEAWLCWNAARERRLWHHQGLQVFCLNGEWLSGCDAMCLVNRYPHFRGT